MTVYDLAATLPDLPALRALCRSIAVAEAAVSPHDDYRYYTYDAHWSETDESFSMDSGSGDEFNIIFCPAGAYIRGFDHESPMSPYAEDVVWPGVLDNVHDVFRPQVDEPAFAADGMPTVTFCLWRQAPDAQWHTGRIDFPEGHTDPDGSDWMCALLRDRTPEAFCSWAEDYYEQAVDVAAVRHIYGQRPLTPEMVAALNPAASFASIANEARRVGYPA